MDKSSATFILILVMYGLQTITGDGVLVSVPVLILYDILTKASSVRIWNLVV